MMDRREFLKASAAALLGAIDARRGSATIPRMPARFDPPAETPDDLAAILAATSTPATFACTITRHLRQPWRMARHLEYIDAAIVKAIHDSQTADTPPILIIEMPPRHGKSELISRYLPAWYIGTHPDHRVLFATNTDKLAMRYGRFSRNVIAEWGPKLFGVQLAPDSQAQAEWNLDRHEGGFFGTSVGGRVGGRGANCFAKGTRITTEQGDLEIGQLCKLKLKPRVLAFNHKTGRPEWRRVVATKTSWASDLVEIQTAAGRILRVTPDHLLFIEGRGYTPASRLRPGDTIKAVAENDLPVLRRSEILYGPHLPEVLRRAARRISLRPLQSEILPNALYGACQNKGWPQACVLQPGMLRTRLLTEARAQLPSLRQGNCRPEVGEVLFSGMPHANSHPSVQLLRQGIQAPAVRVRQAQTSRASRCLLQREMLARTSRDKECPALSILRTPESRWPASPVLLREMQGCGLQEARPGDEEVEREGLPVRKHFSPNESSHPVLLQGMCGIRTLDSHARLRQFSFQRWHELRQVVCGHATANSSKRPEPLRDVRGVERKTETCRSRKIPDGLESCNSSPRRKSREQSAGESNHALPRMPQGAPQLEADTVAVVRHIRTGGIEVYDLQVEECSNLFAEGILAHNCLIIDDLIGKAKDALSESMREDVWHSWEADWFKRLEPKGIVIIVSTRWHTDDLIGRVLNQSTTEDGMPVTRIRLPALAEGDDLLGRAPGEALWPARFNANYLGRIKANTSAPYWNALYQQNPSQHEGTTWPSTYFDDAVIWADGPNANGGWPSASEFHLTAMALDPAKGKAKGDYSAVGFGGVARGLLYVDAVVERMPIETTVGAAIDMAAKGRPLAITIEGNGFQDLAMAGEFNRQYETRGIAPLPLRMIDNTTKKEDRIRRLGTYFHQKRVRFRDTAGCRRLVQQLREFPLAEHDDGPDMLEMLVGTFQWLQAQKRNQDGTHSTEYVET